MSRWIGSIIPIPGFLLIYFVHLENREQTEGYIQTDASVCFGCEGRFASIIKSIEKDAKEGSHKAKKTEGGI